MFHARRSQPNPWTALLLLLGTTALLFGSKPGFAADDKKDLPNIILIFADDKYRNTTTE